MIPKQNAIDMRPSSLGRKNDEGSAGFIVFVLCVDGD
jgi:hypothetical protein